MTVTPKNQPWIKNVFKWLWKQGIVKSLLTGIVTLIFANFSSAKKVEELQAQFNSANTKNAVLLKEVAELKKDYQMFKMATDEFPDAAWYKSVSTGRVLYVNDAYERSFLLPRGFTKNDYVGKTDYAVWDSAIAKKFIENDQLVARTGKPMNLSETIVDSTGVRIRIKLKKFPVFLGGEVVIVGGIAYLNE